jgi:ABC-type branched-subunit amino acid transport system substrate-binding protein
VGIGYADEQKYNMNHTLRYSFLFCFAVVCTVCRAQVDTAARNPGNTVAHTPVIRDSAAAIPQVAIFIPLYLDSAYDSNNNYRYDKSFPKFINPGLEFYEGVKLALDSLKQEKAVLEVRIYDTRSTSQNIAQIVQSAEFQKTGLILGHVNSTELVQLASAAARLGVPFINVNYPNDGGITNNPNLVILNSTLRTHCEGIYRYLQRNYPTKPILLFRKKGVQEDRLKNYFMDIEKTTNSVPLKIKYITLEDNFDASMLASHMDSTIQTVCIAGSLDESFGKALCQGLASLNKTYPSLVIGMPTWDNINDFSLPEYKDEEIVYTTPFYVNPADELGKEIQQTFKTKFYSRPSDMVFRGYETTWHFAKLLLQYGKNLNGSIGEKKYNVFSDFDIEPVFLNRQNMTLDYFENKKLYFIRKVDGVAVGN